MIYEKKPTILPDFLIKPWQLIVDEDITPYGADVFGVIYWYERMKDGYCHASNASIAKILHKGNAKSVSNCIAVLIEKGYVIAEYDPSTNERVSMITLIGMYATPPSTNGTPPLNNGAPLHQPMEHNKNNKKESKIIKKFSNEINRLYKGWLIEMVIGRQKFMATAEGSQARADLLESASRKTRLTDKRKQKLAARLDSLGVELCSKAIVNIGRSDFHRGVNDRKWKATIEWLFNTDEKVEELANR